MQSHQNMPCARLIKQAAGLLHTRFIPDDTRWQAARRGSQPVGLDRFLYLYLLYGSISMPYPTMDRAETGLSQFVCYVFFSVQDIESDFKREDGELPSAIMALMSENVENAVNGASVMGKLEADKYRKAMDVLSKKFIL
jgi:hypothetical protein